MIQNAIMELNPEDFQTAQSINNSKSSITSTTSQKKKLTNFST